MVFTLSEVAGGFDQGKGPVEVGAAAPLEERVWRSQVLSGPLNPKQVCVPC